MEDGRLVMSLEAEKGSFPRYAAVSSQVVIEAMQLAPALPDVLAIGGWHKHIPGLQADVGAGYHGIELGKISDGKIFGGPIKIFSSTHERSHIMMAAGMHPQAPLERCIVLVWEGTFGAFYEWSSYGRKIRRHTVMSDPGAKYGALFALADPTFSISARYPRLGDAGKLMALAAYGDGKRADLATQETVDAILNIPEVYPFHKSDYRESPLYNIGLGDTRFRHGAAYITDQIFLRFFTAARRFDQDNLPLVISGGCGLNCDWNERWRKSRLFTDVFVPPCANDSGSAIGTAIDAQFHFGGDARLKWSVYAGSEFDVDVSPDPFTWKRLPLNIDDIARYLCVGGIVPWVQGKYEIGPRALGHRSLLADPTNAEMREQLNTLKGREDYRPIAPCCRVEELGNWFSSTEADPYMLFFSQVRTTRLPAVTHVDGTARVQAVSS